MKQTKNNHQEETKEIKTSNTRAIHRTDQRHKLYQTNHDNFIKLRKTLEDTIRFRHDPAGQLLNLSTKQFL